MNREQLSVALIFLVLLIMVYCELESVTFYMRRLTILLANRNEPVSVPIDGATAA